MGVAIKRAAVIGAGIMGSTIAAQLANVGIETLLLDIVPPELSADDKKKGLTKKSRDFRNKLARNGLKAALKSSPAAFYIKRNAALVTTGNMEDDLNHLNQADWIIEAVVERLDIKQQVFKKIESVLKPGAIVTSNTSGLSTAAMSADRCDGFKKHFAVTHFFNPPRYMKLIEIVPGPDADPEVIGALAMTCERLLGKGIVYAKDTPNFVANRIGVFVMLSVIRAMLDSELSIEAVDLLTGPVIGRPKSATFRTADLVGLDTFAHVTNNIYNGAPEDESRTMFQSPGFIKEMIKKGLLGEKSGQGFYKKVTDRRRGREILSLDYNTLKHSPRKKVSFPALETAKNLPGPFEKIRSLYYAKNSIGQFTFRHLTESLIYAANRIPEITDNIVNIDNAMKWGFGWELGPFETWDALGIEKSAPKMKAAGYQVPNWVQTMLDNGKTAFYKRSAGRIYFYDPALKDYQEVPVKPEIMVLSALKEQEKKIAGNSGASLIDIGDGVACLEFHTKMNAIGDDILNMINMSVEIVSRDFDGLVIANHGTNFSAGANLPLLLFTAQEEEWDDLNWMVNDFQQTLMRLKYLDKPVVAAPAGMALGGGCEICLAADRVRFGAEAYLGLVEVGVGLIPAGGGTKEMYLRNTEHLFDVQKGGLYPKQIELMPFVARAFETIALAKVSSSGPEAVEMGYLRPTDKLTVNRDYLINDAKKTVLALNLEGYSPPRPKQKIRVAGENTRAMIKLALWTMRAADFITEYDITVSNKVGHILCGGNVLSDTIVSEQYLLDLEREAFLSLCGNPGTQARIQHMLTTGKPLRN
jgi:3-hydroxyacyl-CoA dehydrogenase